MFGLMTVAQHEREMAALREWDTRQTDAHIATWRRVTDEAFAEIGRWRAMAESLRADLADLRKRELPPIPGAEEAEVGAIADEDWTPSAVARREKAAK